MTAKIIAFANQKGGVGKTMLTVQFAHYLRARRNKKVLVIDMDKQANSTFNLLGFTKSDDPTEPPVKNKPIDGATTMFDLFKQDFTNIKPTPTKSGIDLICGRTDISQVFNEVLADGKDTAIQMSAVFHPRENLRNSECMEKYDYILIDCQPQLAPGLIGPMIAADYVVSPLKIDVFGITGVKDMWATMDKLREAWPLNYVQLGVVLNDLDNSGFQRGIAGQMLVDPEIGKYLFDTIISHRSPIARASVDCLPIWMVPNAKASIEELVDLFKEFEKRIKLAEEGKLAEAFENRAAELAAEADGED